MTVPVMEPRSLPVSRTTTAGRIRRLHRGVDRWHQAVTYDRLCRRRVWLLLFTTESSDPEVVAGAIRRFWAAVAQKYGPQRYFTWLEVQARGAAHYHGMWLDPPLHDNWPTKDWLERTWGLGFVKIRQRSRSWFTDRAPDYVKAEAKASLKKGYQQDYSAIPSHIRTFECQRLEFSGADLDAHRDRQLVQYVPASSSPPGSPTFNQQLAAEHLVVWADLRHVTAAAAGCTLWQQRRTRHKRAPARMVVPGPAPFYGGSRVSITRGLRAAGRPAVRRV